MNDADYRRIESEIASDDSPVGIDAKKTHVLILAKLESIERRLDRLESASCSGSGVIPGSFQEHTLNAIGAGTDTFDDTVATLTERCVDVDARLRALVHLIEQITAPETLKALGAISSRLSDIEPMTEMATHAPDAMALATDAFDEHVARLRDQGIDFDESWRNGLAAILYLGQKISTKELESLGTLLRSDVLHPSAVDVVGRLGRALVEASDAPSGSVGPIGAFSKLGNNDTKRSTAFVLEFARRFGAALERKDTSHTPGTNHGDRS